MSLWGKQDAKSQSNTATATITVTAANSTVVGVNTKLSTDFAVGDFLNVGDNDYVFTAIANATVATVRSGINGGAVKGASSNGAYVVSEKPLYVVYSESEGDAGEVYGADADETSANSHVVHSGWVRRTVGTGGRAGRVQFETLVAGGITGDAADDDVLADS